MEEFITIDKKTNFEVMEKKSKFIANIYPISDVKEAEDIIKESKKKYYDARHNCIAYRVYEDNKLIERSNDDGEPSGTAGAPILSILQKNGICNVLVVVTRYFGGVLLGTGGLVSCYSKATMEALNIANKVVKCQGIEAFVKLDYKDLNYFKNYCKNTKIKITKIEYVTEIVCTIEMENNIKSKIMQDISSKSINVKDFKVIGKKIIDKCI